MQPGTSTQNVYLIAFTDHSIQAATAYKVDGDQIHWITREGQEKQAPLSTVDVPFSVQINRDRRVDFRFVSFARSRNIMCSGSPCDSRRIFCLCGDFQSTKRAHDVIFDS